MSKHNYKPSILCLATVAAVYLGQIQYGIEQPLDYANGTLNIVCVVYKLLNTQEDKDE